MVVSNTLVQAEGGAAIIDCGEGVAAFDGRDVLPGAEGLLWNAALRIVVGAGPWRPPTMRTGTCWCDRRAETPTGKGGTLRR